MNRRTFLAAGAAGTAASCARPGSSWRFLTVSQAATLEAVCAQIIPEDDAPGARTAGVVNFIDRQLCGFYKPYRKAYREGLAALDRDGFTRLDPPAQAALLRRIEKDPARAPFFALLVAHTMQGFYGSPRHGGNAGAVSWKMLGLPQPPLRGRQPVPASPSDFRTGRGPSHQEVPCSRG